MDMNYGKKYGPDVWLSHGVPLAASQVFKYKSGKFMTNAAGVFNITATGEIPFGWASVGEYTSSAVASAEKVPLNISREAVYEMPVDAAFTEAEGLLLVGDVCDIVTTDNIQMADIGTSTDDILQIVGFDVDAQTVYVRLAVRLGITAEAGVI